MYARRSITESNAFTLIELLVVVAVIAVLVAILITALSAAKAAGLAALCGSGLKQVTLTTCLYGMDHQEVVLPSYWNWGQVVIAPEWGPFAGAGDGTWSMALYPRYSPDPHIFSCPAMKEYDLQHPYNHPSHPWYPYIMWRGTVYGIDGSAGWNAFRRLADIERPAQELDFCDSIYCPPGDEPFESYVVYKTYRNGPGGLPRHTPNIRHLQSCLVGFFDGHVQSVHSDWIHERGWDYWYYQEKYVLAN